MRLLLRWRQGEISLHEMRAENSEDVDARGETVEVLLGNVKLDFELSPLMLTSESERTRLIEALLTLSRSSLMPDPSVHLEIPAVWGIGLRLPPLNLPPAELAQHLQWELSNAILDPVDQYRYLYALEPDGSIRLAALRARLVELILQATSKAGYKLLGLQLDEPDFARINFLETSYPPQAEQPAAATPAHSKWEKFRTEKPPQKRPKAASGQPSWFLGIIIVAGIIVVALWGWMKLTSERRPGRTPELAIGTSNNQTVTETPGPQIASDTPAPREASARDTTALESVPPPEPSAAKTQVAATGYAPMANCLAVLKPVLGEGIQPTPFELISFTGDRFLLQLTSPPGADPDEICSRLKSASGVLEVSTSLKGRGAAPGTNINGKVSADAGGQAASQLNAAQIIAAGKNSGLRQASAQGLIFVGERAQVLSFIEAMVAQNAAIYRLILVPWGEGQYRAVLEL